MLLNILFTEHNYLLVNKDHKSQKIKNKKLNYNILIYRLLHQNLQIPWIYNENAEVEKKMNADLNYRKTHKLNLVNIELYDLYKEKNY